MKKITLFIASLFIAMASFAEITVDTLWQFKVSADSARYIDTRNGIAVYDDETLLLNTRRSGAQVVLYDATTGALKTDAEGSPLQLKNCEALAGTVTYGGDVVVDANGAIYIHQREGTGIYKYANLEADPVAFIADAGCSAVFGFDVKVDANGNGCLVLGKQNSSTIWYYPIKNNVAGEKIVYTTTLAPGGNVRVNIVDTLNFWVDGKNVLPTLITLENGAIKSEKTISTSAVNINGQGIYQFNVLGYDYLAVGANNATNDSNIPKHSVVLFQVGDDLSLTQVGGFFPAKGLNNGTTDYNHFCEPVVLVDGDVAYLYINAGSNGVAAYKLTGFPENPAQSSAYTTVAQVKAITGESVPVEFTPTDAVITFVLSEGIIIEDETGAVKAESYEWRYADGVKAGMKLTSLSAYWNYKEVIDYGYGDPYVYTYPGVLYTPDTEVLTYTLGEEATVNYQEVTPAALLADYEGYKYRAVKIAKTAIVSDKDGNPAVAAGEEFLTLYYDGNLPGEAVLYGYYGPHPYGEDRGTVFNVVEAELEYTILENADIISEYSADDYSEVQYVMVGEEKLRISYSGDNELPKVATTLKGYKANETYYDYDENGNEIQMTREVFVVVDFTYETITIADFVATTETVGYSSYKCVVYNGEKVYLTAPYGTSIPGMGTVTGYFIEKATSSSVNKFLYVLTAEATGYSNINEYKSAVGAGNTAAKAAALAEGMLISYVYTVGEQSTLFVTQKSGYSTYYSAIRTTTTDKNGKTYAAGDSIKGVKGILSVFGFDDATQQFTATNHLDVEAGNIEITSSGNTANIPAVSSLYGLEYITGANKRSAGSYDMKYSTIPVGQIKAVGDDYYFFSDKGDSILIVTPGFTVPAEYLTERVSVKGYIDVMNSGDKVQVIVPSRADFVTSNVKFASVADMKAAGAAASGITYELENPTLLTYIEVGSEYDWNTGEENEVKRLYVQDATGAMRITLDVAASAACTLAVGDSVAGFKGIFDSYNKGITISAVNATYTVKNSGNAVVPTVITLAELIAAQSAGTYNAMLVRLENVEYIKSQIESEYTPGTFFDIHYFVQGTDTLSYSQGNFNDGFGAVGYKFYQMNNITAVVENGWQGGQYGFWPISQAAIESAVSTEEGATIISIRNNTESKEVKFTGDATTSYITDRGIIIQDGTGAILLDGVDTLALDRKISNVEGTYYPSSADCMARIVPTSLEDKGRGRLSKETVTIDSLVNNIANFEGEIVDIAVAKTNRLAEGVYTMTATNGTAIAVRGEVVPSDAKLTGLVYHVSAEEPAFTVTAYDFYNTGSNRVLMFHELKDYMAKWGPVDSEQYTVSGFTSPVLVNSVFSSQGGTALNVQQTNADGTITGLTVWAMYTPEGVTFEAGDSIAFIKGGYVPYMDLSTTYGVDGYARGRSINAYRYDCHIGDIDYPTDVDSIEIDGEKVLPSIVEIQLGTLIQKINSGNEVVYTEVDDITGFFGATAVDHQAKNYQITGTVVVDTTSYEWDGETVYEYAAYIKVGENKLRLSGINFNAFANKEITVKGNFDIGYALEDLTSFYVSELANVEADFKFVENIAGFLAAADTENEVLILSEVAVTYQNGANIYVRDNSGSLLIYDFDYQNAGYVNGDRLTGVKGKYKDYNGLPEMVEATLPAATAGDAIAPRAISVADLATAGLSEYVVLNEVRFTENLAFSAENRNATVTNDDEETAAIYNQYKLEASWGTNTPVAIVGTVGVYKENRQLNYISHDVFAVEFANIAAIYAKGMWDMSRYEDYTAQSVLARLNSQPTVVDKVVAAGHMGAVNNYYLNDGTGAIVLQAPADDPNAWPEPVEGLNIEVGQKLPAGLLATIDFKCVTDEKWLPTGEVYGAPVLTYVSKVTGVDAEGWDISESNADFVGGCTESDFVEEAVEASLADVLANRMDYAGQLLVVDTTANYYAEVAMDHLTGSVATKAYMFWNKDEAFDVEVLEEEGTTYVFVYPKYTEDNNNYAGELFNVQAENLPAATLEDAATIEVATVRFDWNSIAMGQTLILKEGYDVKDAQGGTLVDVENGELVVNVYANNGSVYVETEAGVMIEVYTVNGLRVFAGVSNTNTTVINGLTDIAIIRVNGVAYKVFVK